MTAFLGLENANMYRIYSFIANSMSWKNKFLASAVTHTGVDLCAPHRVGQFLAVGWAVDSRKKCVEQYK